MPKRPRKHGRAASTPGRARARPSPRSDRAFEAVAPAQPHSQSPSHVESGEALARLSVAVAEHALNETFPEQTGHARRASTWSRDRALARLAWIDRKWVVEAVRSLLRWWGWLRCLDSSPLELRLLWATLLDAETVPPQCRTWARQSGFDPKRIIPLGSAPDWNAKCEGFKRLLGGPPPTLDPWRLFPAWFRSALPAPPGEQTLKQRHLRMIHALQTPAPTWIRVQGAAPESIWSTLRTIGVKPWIHRRLEDAARVDSIIEVAQLPPARQGLIDVHDLSSQCVARCADPHPGERWWVPQTDRPSEAIHLAALMAGRGVVVATHPRPEVVRKLTLRARHTPFRNINTRSWDQKHPPGKSHSFDGVLITPPSSSIGLWRRAPELRWSIEDRDITTFSHHQSTMLNAATPGVRPGGFLVYSVPSVTSSEGQEIVQHFLKSHPNYRLKPFADPRTGDSTDGLLTLWPEVPDSDAWFIARLQHTP